MNEHDPSESRESSDEWLLGRRDLLASASALILTGCLPAIAKPQPQANPILPIGDAHAHLFNGADLPVEGFYKNVLAPNALQGWPQFALAIIDSAMVTLKTFCKTADQERSELNAPFVEAQETSPQSFADEIKKRADPLMAAPQAALANPERDLGASYRALAKLVNHERRRRGEQPLSSPAAPAIDRDMLAQIAQQGADIAGPPGDYEALLRKSPAEIWALIRWAFQMTHSRRAHVHEYLTDMRSPTTKVTLLINLLVDYDDWLGDTPTVGSRHADQVRFWTEYSRSRSAPIQIETFAGYDPLKHAIQKREGSGSSAYFNDLTRWVTGGDPDHHVAGLKLYPPMGFSVWANTPLTSTDRAAGIVRDLWTRPHGWDLAELPTSLDAALDELFDFATEYDVPLLAHGRESNEAYKGAGEKSRPCYWLDRALDLASKKRPHPLRACLAHLYEKTKTDQDVVEILKLNLSGKSNIYFDLAFDDDILDPAKAKHLLDWIADLCRKSGKADDAANYFMYGTDWIMLAQIPHAKRYVPAFDAAVSAHSNFWAARRPDFMGGNLRRFLKFEP